MGIETNIKEAINNSKMNQLQKNVALGFVDRAKNAENDISEIRELIEKVGRCNGYPIIILEDVIIFEKRDRKDDYNFSFLIKKNENWNRTSRVFTTIEEAFIGFLAEKYNDYNSNADQYAKRVLGMS